MCDFWRILRTACLNVPCPTALKNTDLHRQVRKWPGSCPLELLGSPSEQLQTCQWHRRSECPWVNPGLAKGRQKQQMGTKTKTEASVSMCTAFFRILRKHCIEANINQWTVLTCSSEDFLQQSEETDTKKHTDTVAGQIHHWKALILEQSESRKA